MAYLLLKSLDNQIKRALNQHDIKIQQHLYSIIIEKISEIFYLYLCDTWKHNILWLFTDQHHLYINFC